jgi:hypothetical protein
LSTKKKYKELNNDSKMKISEPLAKRSEEIGIKIDWKPLLRTPFTCSIVVPGASEEARHPFSSLDAPAR